MLEPGIGPLAGWCILVLLLASTASQAATPPDRQTQPGARARTVPALPAQAPTIPLQNPGGAAASSRPPPAPPPPDAAPGGSTVRTAHGGPRHIDARLQREIARLRRVAEPRSGFGSTRAAANAAWTLGLIELHAGLAPGSPAQAQTWFERAERFGRQPLAWAGLAWCATDGCKGPPDPPTARQAIDKLRSHRLGRALYLQWLLDTRLQPVAAGSRAGPERVHGLGLPLRDLLQSAAIAGDSQARIELGIEAVANGDFEAARGYFTAAAPGSHAASANLQLLDLQLDKGRQPRPGPADEAEQLFERARRAHRGAGVPVDYTEALRLYRAAARSGSAGARRMLGLIVSRPQPDGSMNPAWMAQLAWLESASTLLELDTRALAGMMYRDPTPLFDLLPEAWQRALARLVK